MKFEDHIHPFVGKLFGNYVLEELIGRGAVGLVFGGKHRFLGDPVAVKVLHGTAGFDETAKRRFFDEAKAARQIAHDNVVRVLDFGQADTGELYMVMERLEGETLAARIQRGPLPESAVRRLGQGIAEGLAAAHAAGIVHRDLKPANVFLVKDQVKILDFGLARDLDAGSHTAVDAVIGTPLYMAPEQGAGSRFAVFASDLYSLGAVLFEMLTGRPPFRYDSAATLLAAHAREAPVKPSALGVVVSSKLEALILACLAKRPANRPEGALALAKALEVNEPDATGSASRAAQPHAQPGRRAAVLLSAIAAITAVGAALALDALRDAKRPRVASTPQAARGSPAGLPQAPKKAGSPAGTAAAEVPTATTAAEVATATATVHMPMGTTAVHLPPPTATVPMSPSTAAVHLPPSTAAVHLPPSTAAVRLPPSTAAVHLPPSTAAVHLPPSTAAVHLPPSAAAVPALPSMRTSPKPARKASHPPIRRKGESPPPVPLNEDLD